MRAALALALLACAPAGAEVAAVTPAGFEVRHEVTVAAPPERAWAVLVEPKQWWSGAHTYSGDAAKLSLDARPGGCFREALPGGGVEHLRVVYLQPRKQLRLAGALGPLQGDSVAGALTITLAPTTTGTTIVLRYVVGGWRPGGMAAIAGPVDGVLGEQLTRLAAAVR